MVDEVKLSYKQQLDRPEWSSKRNKILERDKYSCKICKSKTNLLEVHHIRYANYALAWEYPDEMLVTLCYECHKKVHGLKDDSDRSLKMQHISEIMDGITLFKV